MKSKWYRDYGCPAVLISYHLRDENFFSNLKKSYFWKIFFSTRFTKTYQNRADTALPYAMQSEFSRVLASEMVSLNIIFLCIASIWILFHRKLWITGNIQWHPNKYFYNVVFLFTLYYLSSDRNKYVLIIFYVTFFRSTYSAILLKEALTRCKIYKKISMNWKGLWSIILVRVKLIFNIRNGFNFPVIILNYIIIMMDNFDFRYNCTKRREIGATCWKNWWLVSFCK